MECDYGDPECIPDEDYELMCDDHRREYAENMADTRNDFD